MTYEEALAAVNGLESRPWREGLDRMRALVQRAGLESALTAPGYIHIAGTNGKGTTTAFVESILRHQGHRTGAFYSPYVIDYRERIQANGRLISREELLGLVETLLPVANGLADTEFGGASKFELEAAMGLAYWQSKACDWVALEVGLGGRLDATNVVTPRACIIVSIGFDHMSILGKTLEDIAGEKAGIIKPGIPVIVGEMPPKAQEVILARAKDLDAPAWVVGRHIEYWEDKGGLTVQLPGHSFWGLKPPLLGERTNHNVALALAACFVAKALKNTSEPLLEGVQTTWLPGRLERHTFEGREVVFDGAHNPEAARALAKSLPEGPVRLVTNMLAGHEVEDFYRVFRETLPGRVVGADAAPIHAPRALQVAEAVRRLESLGIFARGHGSVAEALRSATTANDGLVVVTGSNYLVGEALRAAQAED